MFPSHLTATQKLLLVNHAMGSLPCRQHYASVMYTGIFLWRYQGHNTCTLCPNWVPKTNSSSLWLPPGLQCHRSSKSNLNPPWKGSSSTWGGKTTSRILNLLLVDLFWGLCSFEILILQETGRWETSKAADTGRVLSNTYCHATHASVPHQLPDAKQLFEMFRCSGDVQARACIARTEQQ